YFRTVTINVRVPNTVVAGMKEPPFHAFAVPGEYAADFVGFESIEDLALVAAARDAGNVDWELRTILLNGHSQSAAQALSSAPSRLPGMPIMNLEGAISQRLAERALHHTSNAVRLEMELPLGDVGQRRMRR